MVDVNNTMSDSSTEPSSDDEQNFIPFAVQCKRIKLLQKPLERDQVWYLVDAKWWQFWKQHVGFDSEEQVLEAQGPHPGPIDNSSLSHPEFPLVLRQHATEGEDFVCLISEAWHMLHKWYSGEGPVFPRTVITRGLSQEASIELYPPLVDIRWVTAAGTNDEDTATKVPLSVKASMQNLLQMLAESKFPDDEEEALKKVRLWHEASAEMLEGGAEGEGEAEAERDAGVAGEAEEKKDGEGENEGGEEEEAPTKDGWFFLKEEDLDKTFEKLGFEPDQRFLVEAQMDGQWTRVAPKKRAWNDFRVGDVIDAMDTQRKWFQSCIRDVKDTKILVHFLGWSARWDAWIDKDSDKLARKGTNTKGVYKAESRLRSSYYSSYNQNEENKPVHRGVVGLRNLGNTCFMNSIVQCVSNTEPLTTYFLDDRYAIDLNTDNPLGWGGKIATAWANLMKEVWSNKFRVVAPRQFKTTIGEFQPRFSGYQQQDSAELLAFLLDGLHEDLNRVKKKPYTETVESCGRPDKVVAKDAWDTHLLRNQSVVVDLLQGQLKSVVDCPSCPNISVTFDPYTTLSVPLPQEKFKHIQVVFVPASGATDAQYCSYAVKVPKLGTMADLKRSLSAMVDIDANELVACDLWHRKIYKVYTDHDSVSRISARDDTFVFHVPGLSKVMKTHKSSMSPSLTPAPLDHVLVKFHNQFLRPNPHYNTSRWAKEFDFQDFGVPGIVLLPLENLTVGDVRRAAADAIAPFLLDEEQVAERRQRMEEEAEQESMSFSSSSLDSGVEVEGQGEGVTTADDEGVVVVSTSTEAQTPHQEEHSSLSASPVAVQEPAQESPVKVDITEAMSKLTVASEVAAQVAEEEEDAVVVEQPDNSTPYSLVLMDSTGRSCGRCDFRSYCDGCEMTEDDDEVLDLSSKRALSLVIRWRRDTLVHYDDNAALDPPQHASIALASAQSKPKKTSIQLSHCLDLFTSEEQLEQSEAWYCSTCKEHRCAKKKMSLWSAPEILIIQLKRFNNSGHHREKIDALVDFPFTDFDLSPWLAHPDNSSHLYDLYAVSNHYGGLGGGHYTAFVKNPLDRQWYSKDDSHASGVNAEKVLTSAAYVLFYRRQQPGRRPQSDEIGVQ